MTHLLNTYSTIIDQNSQQILCICDNCKLKCQFNIISGLLTMYMSTIDDGLSISKALILGNNRDKVLIHVWHIEPNTAIT